MDIKGLVARIRSEFLDDDAGSSEDSYLFKSPHIIASLSHAERELCRRLHLLSDSTTPAICQINLVAVNGVFPRSYGIDDRILRIERLKFPGASRPLLQTTTSWLDRYDQGWDEAEGTPTHYAVDNDDYSITFNRQPLTGGIVSMLVKRLPLMPINIKSTTESPEIKQRDDELIHGALKYIYLKPDIEGYDPNLATKWANQFEADINQIVLDRAAMNPQEYVCRPERF